MLLLQGYLKDLPGQVCLFQKSLYGLKQASRQWNIEFTIFLKSLGFSQSSHDHCLFVKTFAESFMALLIYLDDIIITGTSIDDTIDVKTALYDKFTIKDLGHLKYFLGLEVARSD